MHEVLRGLVARLGPGVFDDPDNFRGALDDVLDESASLGDQNLVVDAVRLGAYASMMTMLGQGGDPSSTVAQAGARLARDRGGEDRVSASWACACLAYAVGAVGEAEVRHYRTARHTREAAPPTEIPAAPVTQARPEVLPPTPAPLPPAPEPPPVRGRWVVPVLLVLALVLAGVAGLLGADLLRDDDPPETTEPSDSPTMSAPTTAPTTVPPTTPTSTPPTTTPTTTAPAPVRTTVEHTCGASGTGDCFLTERAGPTVGADRLRRYQEGDTTVRVTCQLIGDEVFSSVLGRTSRIWARTTRGGYVAAIFLDGIDKYDVTTPC